MYTYATCGHITLWRLSNPLAPLHIMLRLRVRNSAARWHGAPSFSEKDRFTTMMDDSTNKTIVSITKIVFLFLISTTRLPYAHAGVKCFICQCNEVLHVQKTIYEYSSSWMLPIDVLWFVLLLRVNENSIYVLWFVFLLRLNENSNQYMIGDSRA